MADSELELGIKRLEVWEAFHERLIEERAKVRDHAAAQRHSRMASGYTRAIQILKDSSDVPGRGHGSGY